MTKNVSICHVQICEIITDSDNLHLYCHFRTTGFMTFSNVPFSVQIILSQSVSMFSTYVEFLPISPKT